jgi:hypothetical protein
LQFFDIGMNRTARVCLLTQALISPCARSAGPFNALAVASEAPTNRVTAAITASGEVIRRLACNALLLPDLDASGQPVVS